MLTMRRRFNASPGWYVLTASASHGPTFFGEIAHSLWRYEAVGAPMSSTMFEK